MNIPRQNGLHADFEDETGINPAFRSFSYNETQQNDQGAVGIQSSQWECRLPCKDAVRRFARIIRQRNRERSLAGICSIAEPASDWSLVEP